MYIACDYWNKKMAKLAYENEDELEAEGDSIAFKNNDHNDDEQLNLNGDDSDSSMNEETKDKAEP